MGLCGTWDIMGHFVYIATMILLCRLTVFNLVNYLDNYFINYLQYYLFLVLRTTFVYPSDPAIPKNQPELHLFGNYQPR